MAISVENRRPYTPGFLVPTCGSFWNFVTRWHSKKTSCVGWWKDMCIHFEYDKTIWPSVRRTNGQICHKDIALCMLMRDKKKVNMADAGRFENASILPIAR